MRWLKWILVAAWLGVHALLWALLPAVPFALNGRAPCKLPDSLYPPFYFSDWAPWARHNIVSRPNDNFAFAGGIPKLVAGDATSIHIYDLATRQMQMTWETGVTGQFPQNGVRVWGLSANGHYAVFDNGADQLWLINLDSGVVTQVADHWNVQARFIPDLGRGRSHRERLLLLHGWTLSILDLGYPRLMTWEIPSGKRLQTVEHAWGCGWCADGRLVVRTEDGDCYFADAELNRLGEVPLPLRLRAMDDLAVDEAGRYLVVKYVRPASEPVRRIKNWLKPGSGDSLIAEWECFDLNGRTIAAVPGWTGGCDVSRDGKYFAVGSPDGKFVDIYDLPRPNPRGLVLALMIAEVAAAIAWTAWRRRRLFRSRQNDRKARPAAELL